MALTFDPTLSRLEYLTSTFFWGGWGGGGGLGIKVGLGSSPSGRLIGEW